MDGKNWNACKYENGKIVAENYPPDGWWLQWINADGVTQIARFKEDGNDHFFPIAEHFPIEEVVAWREL